jgi:hypothetical protein
MGILAMGQGYPGRDRLTLPSRDGTRLDNFDTPPSSPHHHDDDDMTALRAENAQLRDLVVRLSCIVARNALNRK